MPKDNRSFFEKLTGAVRIDPTEEDTDYHTPSSLPSFDKKPAGMARPSMTDWEETDADPEEGELNVDVYQTPTDIVIKTMVAGVRPEDLDVSITRDSVTIKGKRESEKTVSDEDYFHQELYWGTFSRTISLPAEVEVEDAEALEKHGLLIIRMPKINKNKQARLKVKG